MTGLASGNRSLLEFGVAATTAPGESQSGDLHLVTPTSCGWLLGVVDGLGHGEEAATAARAAVDLLSRQPDASLIHLVRRCHERLKGTRGVVMTLVALDETKGSITSLGVGNIEGLVLNPDSAGRNAIMLRPGVVGYRLPQLQAAAQAVSPGDLLILFTDGIRNEFSRQFPADVPCTEIAEQISRDYHRGTDDTLVLVARYRGRPTSLRN